MDKFFFPATAGVALLSLLLLAPATRAQDATGKIAGNVTDASGGVVPRATIVVTNLDTKASKQTVTDRQGFYQVLQLPIGYYEVSAEAAGFSKVIARPHSPLEINQTLRVDLALELGTARTLITVEGHAGNVETEDNTVGGTVTGQAIFELPLNGRDTLDLLKTQPGVTPTNPDSTAAGNYSIGGGRTDSVTYLLDGGLNNDLLDNSAIVDPNPDAVAEFRVLESTYSAEYGRNAGGIVSVVTKSGTNQLHGTAYDYVRNDYFDANDFFSNQQNLPRAILKRNQYGATFGGPVVIPHVVNGRNKLFFFFPIRARSKRKCSLKVRCRPTRPPKLRGISRKRSMAGPILMSSSSLQPIPTTRPTPCWLARVSSILQKCLVRGICGWSGPRLAL